MIVDVDENVFLGVEIVREGVVAYGCGLPGVSKVAEERCPVKVGYRCVLG